MKYYRSYMDRQEVSAGTHEKLMDLTAQPRAPRRPWARYGALAACALLAAGVGVWRLSPAPGYTLDAPAVVATPTDAPGQSQPDNAQAVEPSEGFVVHSPAQGDKLAFPTVPELAYQDMDGAPEVSADRAYEPGTFTVDLTLEDIQAIFRGPGDRPEADSPKAEQGDLPWALFWDGYTIHGMAWYSGQGQFTELTIWGEQDRADFTLELRLGALPFTCVIDMSRGDATRTFDGVEVTSWRQSYDREGDGLTDYVCGSEFMTGDGIGVRFRNTNAPMRSEYGGTSNLELGGSAQFNALFVRQAIAGGLYLDHLMTREDIPAWRDVTFDTLGQARQEADFAPYLPEAEPGGYSACSGNKDFFGRLSYQEGNHNMLFVRWSWGYDYVEVEVRLPEGEGGPAEAIDVSRPETYDVRLYPIPWCDSVPEEYRSYFLSTPLFRAEDMSLDIVEARMVPHDTGGQRCDFSVLHENGVVVSYLCAGMTARQVWEMVESTLP